MYGKKKVQKNFSSPQKAQIDYLFLRVWKTF